MRFLVVDDDPMIPTSLRRLLRSAFPCEVEIESDPFVAMERAACEEFDIVLFDAHMQGLSGVDFHRLIARRRPSVAKKIILMTGVVGPGSLEPMEQLKVPLLLKPFGLARLIEAVELIAGSHASTISVPSP